MVAAYVAVYSKGEPIRATELKTRERKKYNGVCSGTIIFVHLYFVILIVKEIQIIFFLLTGSIERVLPFSLKKFTIV